MQDVSRSNLASYLCWNTHVEEWLVAILATKSSAGVTPEVNLRECISHMPPPNANKATHSGFETQRRCHQKSKTWVSVAPQKGLRSSKNFQNEKKIKSYKSYMKRSTLPSSYITRKLDWRFDLAWFTYHTFRLCTRICRSYNQCRRLLSSKAVLDNFHCKRINLF